MNDMRKLMEVVAIDNTPEQRRKQIVDNFKQELGELIQEYTTGAKTLGDEELSDEIIKKLEQTLQDSTFGVKYWTYK